MIEIFFKWISENTPISLKKEIYLCVYLLQRPHAMGHRAAKQSLLQALGSAATIFAHALGRASSHAGYVVCRFPIKTTKNRKHQLCKPTTHIFIQKVTCSLYCRYVVKPYSIHQYISQSIKKHLLAFNYLNTQSK